MAGNGYDQLREKNAKELEEFLRTAFEDPEYKEIVELHENSKEEFLKKSVSFRRKKRENDDFTVRFSYDLVPLERRQSSRLLNKPPQCISNEDDTNSDSDIENLENVVFRKRKSKKIRRAEPFEIVPVESITESYISNIAQRDTIKKYSQSGTSCHQCRQKTLDSKTFCRNTNCIGVRGHFCGPCLSNRYGEDAAKALMNPNWHCPPCRGICNCSICRTREGKRPTGILAPLAFKYGHNSVKEFLDSLKEKINDKRTLKIINKTSDDEDGELLGFNKDRRAVMTRKALENEEADLIGFKMGQAVTNFEYDVICEL